MKKENWQERTELQVGPEAMEKLSRAKILVAGLGGVGSYAAEQLCRAGTGNMTIMDGDYIRPSNRNRQLPALLSTENRLKTEVMGERLKDINPDLNLIILNEFIRDDRMVEILSGEYDYVVDAIDMLSPKVYLIYHCIQRGLNIVSSMGSGGKYDPSLVKVADISATHNCRFAYDIRKRLHKLGVYTGMKAVYSPEYVPKESVVRVENETNKKSLVGTLSYMPAVFGCFCASVAIRDIIGK